MEIEEPDREEREQVDERHREEEDEAPADRDVEAEAHREEDHRHLDDPDEQIRRELAEHQPERIDRRDEELLERPLLALAHDGDGREDDRDDLEEDRDEPGDDVVRGAAVGVEEDDRLDGERRLRCGDADLHRLVRRLEVLVGGDAVHRREGLRAHGRVLSRR